MKLKLLSLTLSVTLLPWCVRAEEGSTGHYVPGATADFIDALPGKPGPAAVNFLTFYNGGAGVGRSFEFGVHLALGVESTVYADTVALLYETPQLPILGASYAVSAAIPFVWMEIKAQTELTGPGGRVLQHNVRDTTSGLGDIAFSPFMLGWTQLNGDLKCDLRMSIYAPTGSYDVNQLANPGINYWTFEPGFFLSWLSSKIGTEVSFFSAFDFSTTNNTTDYLKVPTDRAIDGVDQSEFFLGKQSKSNRDGFVIYVGNEIYGVKRHNWKMMFKELATGTSPVEQWSIPRFFNLNLDPKEEHSLSYGAEYGWVRFPAGKIMTDYMESLKKYPPIPPGAPDPYEPATAAK